MLQPRLFMAYLALPVSVAFAFVVYVTLNESGIPFRRPSEPERPDLSRYRHIQTLSADEFPLDDPQRRVILIGDIHGMDRWFRKLLDEVDYDSQTDVLVHTGDFIARGDYNGSMAVIDFMTTYNVAGVRGNHDQKVLEWREWMEWFDTLWDASEWLAELESAWNEAEEKGESLKRWVKEQRKEARGRDALWWKKIPKGWIPFGDHYRIAKALTEEQRAYLLSLPLKIHVPSAHTFVVHAGLLPGDVRYDYFDRERQPLARIPCIDSSCIDSDQKNVEALRSAQEREILERVPQNTIPWNNLNMRSVLRNNDISKKASKGTPWGVYWNTQMDMCNGYDLQNTVDKSSSFRIQGSDALDMSSQYLTTLPCHPSTVIYGHTAARGLDIGRFSVGLDTGCVHGRKLTALILGPNPLPGNEEWEEVQYDVSSNDGVYEGDLDDDDSNFVESAMTERTHSEKHRLTIRFGDNGQATLVGISCPQ
ncbi:hypothetical protein NP233_g1946 [Leucocoprinus birnbaumii]|uniref:Calcineurin-like phosphoesterase domain-containing protein n=1 Tax=Leucocoprinus birnbaumii TaxID=56174 RepID=A0AAD5VZ90_9AGAR|nr:hypothetical protein NP233_g1946 [Leucocoprinus birnbaumii]